jgi:hypothetical protein
MAFLDDIRNDVLAIIAATDEFARPATYRPKAGGSLGITVILERGQDLAAPAAGKTEADGVILVNAVDVAEPRYLDEVDIEGKTWIVERIAGGDGYVWKLEARRDLRPTFKR